jgi:GPH family glycoside/pentoside/hexuronide:cation symporter
MQARKPAAVAAATRLSLAVRLAYGAPNLGLALVIAPMLIYLPRFYSDVVGVPVAWLGGIFVVGRVLDAVTDPLAGILSDRTRSHLGRRRPWILWGSVPLALLSVGLYIPPRMGPWAASVWATGMILAWFLLLTVVAVPYRALGPELTDDYDERTGLFAIREGLFVLGTVLAAAGPGILGWLDGEGDERRHFAWYAVFAGVVLLATCLWCGFRVKERFSAHEVEPGPRESPFRQIRSAFANRPFVILLSAFVVLALGSTLPAVLINFFVTYVLRSDLLPIFLVAYFGVGIACLPVWVRFSKRAGKKRAWLSAMVVNAGFFLGVAFLGQGDDLAYGLLVAGSGIGGVAVLALPYAMQADVIDRDEVETGERREGLYGGLWSIAEKMAAALGVGVSLLVLDLAGYVPNQSQSAFVLAVLKGLYVGVPVTCTAVGFAIALRYPIDKNAHDAISEKLRRA